MSPRIGELFAGYGGLGLGVQQVYGGEVAWVSEFDKGPSKILAHRFSGVPNHGDITKIDWAAVEPVDILTGGSPCQDLSHAGARAGMTEGTRSNLWVAMREAIAQLRPPMVVWENVGGAFSAAADSEVEPCAGCVGDGSGVHLRALGRVLGDLSTLGYDASWHALRAADVGAPHGRLRVFVAALDLDGSQRRASWARQDQARTADLPLGRGHGAASDNRHLGHERSGSPRDGWPGSADGDSRTWGKYASAIARWECRLGRPAPPPTFINEKGERQLSPWFGEWFMGLPAGWVTDVPGITRNEALKALGNGVVPQQAAEALRVMAAWQVAA